MRQSCSWNQHASQTRLPLCLLNIPPCFPLLPRRPSSPFRGCPLPPLQVAALKIEEGKRLTLHPSKDSNGVPSPRLLVYLLEFQTSQSLVGSRFRDFWCPSTSPRQLPALCRLRKYQWLTFCGPRPPKSSSLVERECENELPNLTPAPVPAPPVPIIF